MTDTALADRVRCRLLPPTYYDQFKCHADIPREYSQGRPLLEMELVYAGYTYEDYSGNALIVFIRDGEWWENHDNHCSCIGLEKWEPERTSAEAILMRPEGDWPGLHAAVRLFTVTGETQ